jgi:hypothetical protein
MEERCPRIQERAMDKENPPIFVLSVLTGFRVVGSDDRIGTIKDFLFVDDGRCAVWWLTPAPGCRDGRCWRARRLFSPIAPGAN